MLRPEVEIEFKAWLRDAAMRQGLSQADVAWKFPFQIHPQTVAGWFQGRATPRYAELVGLCTALGEIPPSLRGFCPRDTETRT